MKDIRARVTVVAVALLAQVGAAAAQNAPAMPVPRPFPGAGTTSAPAPPQTPAPAQAQAVAQQAPVAPVIAPVGVPVYPTADFLASYDAGSGQTYVLYGTNLPFVDIVAYYRTALKTGGREIFKTPATHQFDVGRYQDDRMAFPPGVVVKDYSWNNSPGYLFVAGTTEKRYKTIIQIVAPGPTP